MDDDDDVLLVVEVEDKVVDDDDEDDDDAISNDLALEKLKHQEPEAAAAAVVANIEVLVSQGQVGACGHALDTAPAAAQVGACGHVLDTAEEASMDDHDDVLLVVDVDRDDEDNVVDDPIGSGRASSASVAPRGGWGHA